MTAKVKINEVGKAKWAELLDDHGKGKLQPSVRYDDLDHDKYEADHVIDRGMNTPPGSSTPEKSNTGYMRKGADDYVMTVTSLPT